MYKTIWYDNLIKPAFNPPASIFSPVWIILYGTILVSLILFAIRPSSESKLKGYIYFITQMLLNLAWSPAFFYLHNIGLALGIIILLDITVIMTMIQFFACYILIPYLLWILFATYLNVSFFVLNT